MDILINQDESNTTSSASIFSACLKIGKKGCLRMSFSDVI
jgi:hypothetical protein